MTRPTKVDLRRKVPRKPRRFRGLTPRKLTFVGRVKLEKIRRASMFILPTYVRSRLIDLADQLRR